MASPRTTIVLLASLLGVSSCRQKENKPDASLSEQRETPGQSSASSAPLAVVNPVPPDTVVALAVDTGMGRLEIRTGFIFSPPISTKSGKNVAVTLLPEGAKAHRFGYVWSPDGRLWSQCQLANQDGNLVFFSMPKGSPAPALPVENASTKPDQPGFSARLSSVAIDGAAAPAETDQLNEENLALLLQIQALEKTKAGTPPPNQDRNQWIQEQRKLTDQRRALDIRLEAIRARAGQLGIQLPTKAMEPLPAPSRPPEFVATGKDSSSTSQKVIPTYGLVGAGGSDAMPFSRIEKSCILELRSTRVWLSDVTTGQPRVNLAPSICTGVQDDCLGSLQIVEGSNPPSPPAEHLASTRLDENNTKISEALPTIPPGTSREFTGRLFIRSSFSEPWLSSESFHFRVNRTDNRASAEWLTNSTKILFAPQEAGRREKNAIQVASTRTFDAEGKILHAALGGAGKFLALVREGKTPVVRLDLATMKATGISGLEGTPGKMLVTADLKRIFVVDRDGRRLRAYSLDSLSLLAETSIPTEFLPLAIAAGHSSTEGPLLLSSRDTESLWQPADLRLIPTPINVYGDPPWDSNNAGRLTAPPGGWLQKIPDSISSYAAPDGTSFTIRKVSGRDTPGLATIFQIGGRWDYIPGTSNGQLLPQWNRGQDFNKEPRASTNYNRAALSPTLGDGYLYSKNPNRGDSDTIPPSPPLLSYFASTGNNPLATFEAGTPSSESSVVSGNVWFDPITLGVISWSGNQVMSQNLDRTEWDRALASGTPVILNQPPKAIRGRHWTFQPVFSIPSSPNIGVSARGIQPEAISFTNGQVDCLIPVDFPENALEVTFGSGESALTIEVAVEGLRPARWVGTNPSDTPVAVSVSSLMLDHPVDRLYLADKGRWLVAANESGTFVTIIDMSTRAIIAKRRFMDGPGLVTVTPSALYRWSKTSGALEKRRLPDLAAEQVTLFPADVKPLVLAASHDQPLQSLVAAYEQHEESSRHGMVVRISPENLAATPPAPMDFLWHPNNNYEPFVSASANGNRIFFGNHWLDVAPSGINHERLQQVLEEDQVSRISDDGTIAYQGRKAITLKNPTSWQAPENATVIPVSGGEDCFTLTLSGERKAGEQGSMTLYSRSGMTPRGTLSGLAEYDTRKWSSLRADRALAAHTLLDARSRFLITTSLNTRELLFRQLPESAFAR